MVGERVASVLSRRQGPAQASSRYRTSWRAQTVRVVHRDATILGIGVGVEGVLPPPRWTSHQRQDGDDDLLGEGSPSVAETCEPEGQPATPCAGRCHVPAAKALSDSGLRDVSLIELEHLRKMGFGCNSRRYYSAEFGAMMDMPRSLPKKTCPICPVILAFRSEGDRIGGSAKARIPAVFARRPRRWSSGRPFGHGIPKPTRIRP